MSLCLTVVSLWLQRLSDTASDAAAAASDKASAASGAPKRTYRSILDSLTSVRPTPSLRVHFCSSFSASGPIVCTILIIQLFIASCFQQ